MVLRVVPIVLLACCAASWAYWLAAWICLGRILRRRKSTQVAFAPPVSILKPVKGLDVGALENFASFCTQDYPEFELLFGVACQDDPAVRVIENLRRRFPQRAIKLIVVDAARAHGAGVNPKAAILEELQRQARGQVLVVSDSDIRVGGDYLRRVVAPLADARVGLVTCLYRGQSPRNLPARLAALHMDAAFSPSAALAHTIGTCLGLGATLAVRAADLARAGGYAAIADYLLDDYELAARIAALGLRVHLSDYVVAIILGPIAFAEQWQREVRWARGIHCEYPVGYPGQIFTFSAVLGLAAAALSPWYAWAWAALPIGLAVRWFVAWRCAVLLGQQERGYLIWLPLRDLLSAAVWAVGLAGRGISWRGTRFGLGRDGRLQPLAERRLPRGLLARAVRRLDAHLRWRDGIFEFSNNDRCILRLSIAAAPQRMQFADGTCVEPGEPLGVLHFWNEHLPLIPRDGPDLRWAMEIRHAMGRSLTELTEAVQRDPRLTHLKAFGGNAVFVSGDGDSHLVRLAGRYGFEPVAAARKSGFWVRFHDFWENFLLLGLQWAFNPGGLRGKRFLRHREPLWISRDALIRRHARCAGPRHVKPPQAVAG